MRILIDALAVIGLIATFKFAVLQLLERHAERRPGVGPPACDAVGPAPGSPPVEPVPPPTDDQIMSALRVARKQGLI